MRGMQQQLGNFGTISAFACRQREMYLLLGAFAKLRKATSSFVTSVILAARPRVRIEQHRFHWKDIREILYWGIYYRGFGEIAVWLKSDKLCLKS